MEKKKLKAEEQKAKDAIMNEQIAALQDEMAGVINERIRAITSTNPGATDKAIEDMRENPAMKVYIANKERALQRPLEVEDFRTDKRLREWVKKKIIEANSEDFQLIFAPYETIVSDLRKALA